MSESSYKSLISRHKWFILGGIGLVFFFVCGTLALFILELLPDSKDEQSSEMLLSTDQSEVIFKTNTPILTATVDETPENHLSENSELNSIREVAFVSQVIDGDTIEVFLNGELIRVRYIGIDCPELGMPGFDEATGANRRLIDGQVVEMERDVTGEDQFGRLLRYVYLADGTLVNAELVRQGIAKAVAYPPDLKHQELLIQFEQEAQAAGIGFWAPPTPTVIPEVPVPTDLIVIDPVCSQFNAPGNDNENKNEEFVCISNQSGQLVDMSGWSIRDEYGWTYSIRDLALEPGALVIIRSGCGEDTRDNLYWCMDETAVWNNDGDCVNLRGKEGELITQYCY